MAAESGATSNTRTITALPSQPQPGYMHTPLSQTQLQHQQELQYRRQQLMQLHLPQLQQQILQSPQQQQQVQQQLLQQQLLQQQQTLQQQQQHQNSHPQAPTHHPLGPHQQQQPPPQDPRQDPPTQDHGGPRSVSSASPFPPTAIITNHSNAAAMGANAQILKQQLPTPAMTTAPLPSAATGTSQNGIAVLKLMQFSDRLTPESEPTDISVWNNFVDEFFSPDGVFKLTLLNTESQLKRQHTIGRPCIARVFQTQYLCGVTSMQLTLDQTNIFLMPNVIMLECPRSSFIYRYSNGSLVVLSGTLTVDLMTDTRGGLKIDRFIFECSIHEEFVARQYIKTAPPPPPAAASSKKKTKATGKKTGGNSVPPTPMMPDSAITPWGIPARIVHLLEISDTAYSFADIPFYSIIADLSANLAMCLRTKILEEQVMRGQMGLAARQASNPNSTAGLYRAGQLAGTPNNQPPIHSYGPNPAAADLWKRIPQNPTSPYPVTETTYAASAATTVSPYTHNVALPLVGSVPVTQNKRKLMEEEAMADGPAAKNARKLQRTA